MRVGASHCARGQRTVTPRRARARGASTDRAPRSPPLNCPPSSPPSSSPSSSSSSRDSSDDDALSVADAEDDEASLHEDAWRPAMSPTVAGDRPPVHWAVTGAFHAVLWEVMCYAGHSVPFEELCAWRTVLELTDGCTSTQAAAPPATGAGALSRVGRLSHPRDWPLPDASTDGAALRVACADASELLLRLALRRPTCFTVKGIDALYGEQLHVRRALRALEDVTLPPEGEWIAAGRRKRSRRGAGAAAPGEPLVARCTGTDVAELIVSTAQSSRTARRRGEARLLQVLRTARGTDLRACAVALHRCCCALHAELQESAVDSSPHRPQADGPPACARSSSAAPALPRPPPPASADAVAAASKEDASAATLLGIPMRKRELIAYLMSRSYRRIGAAEAGQRARELVLPPARECELLAQCWATFVGDCVVVHTAVKTSVTSAAELFHVLTGNFGASSVLATLERHPTPTHSVAKAPSLLLLRSQLRVLSRCEQGDAPTRVAEDSAAARPLPVTQPVFGDPFLEDSTSVVELMTTTASAATAAAGEREEHRGNDSVQSIPPPPPPPVPPPLSWKWASLPYRVGPSAGAMVSLSPVRVCIFPDAASLEAYRRALGAHRALFDVTLGASTFAQKCRARDPLFLSSSFHSAMSALAALRAGEKRASARLPPTAERSLNSSSPAAPQTTRREEEVAPPRPATDAVPTIHDVLRRHGVRAEHLLQFTPAYRWYAMLDLLFPLLESARLYEEAVRCLRQLLEIPVYSIRPGAAPGCPAAAHYAFLYRPQKRGEWLCRLSQDLVHLRRKEEAMQVLLDAHEAWCAAGDARQGGPVPSDAAPASTASCAVAAVIDSGAALPPPFFGGAAAGGTRHGPAAAAHAASCLGSSAMSTELSSRLARSLGPSDLTAPSRQQWVRQQLPASVQRRARLLRAIWPEPSSGQDHNITNPNARADDNDDGDAEGDFSPALYHACVEHQRQHWLRRADVLSMEYSLRVLHRSLRRWTPLPRRLTTLQDRTQAVRHVCICAVRDPMDAQMWRDPALPAQAALGVEDFVRQRCVRLWNLAEGARRLSCKEDGTPSRGGRQPSGQRGEAAPSSAAFVVNVVDDEEEEDGGAKRAGRREDGRPTPAPDNPSTGTGVWRGLHCEGTWVAYAARALLWNSYTHGHPLLSPVAASGSSDGGALGTGADALTAYLWLSPFQEGPLDLLSPLSFTAYRRRLIDAQLSHYEHSSKATMLREVAERLLSPAADPGGVVHRPPSPPPIERFSAAAAEKEEVEEEEEKAPETWRAPTAGELSGAPNAWPRVADDHDDLLLSPPALDAADPAVSPAGQREQDVAFAQDARGASNERDIGLDGSSGSRTGRPAPSRTAATRIPDAVKLEIGGFPLLEVLRAVPKAPLLRLLRCLYLGEPTEGYSVKFSGFPDLLLWRESSRPPLSSQGQRQTSATLDAWAGEASEDDDDEDDTAAGAGAQDWRDGDDSPVLLARDASGTAVSSVPARTPSRRFRLIEVKSPSDTLSSKQIVMNDCLQRCGFDVCVANVVDTNAAAEAAARKRAPWRKAKAPATASAAPKSAPQKIFPRVGKKG